MRFDLTVGQRVVAGFTLLLFFFGGALFAVARSDDTGARAARDFAQNIAPLREKAVQLERAVFQVAIETRAYLISPDDLNADTQRNAVDRARSLERELRAMPKDEHGDALYAAVLPLLEAYVATADKAMQQRRGGTLSLRPERTLGDAREQAITAIRAFSDHESVRMRAALAGMIQARERAKIEAQVALALGVALFVCISLVITQWIRRPLRELVEVARSFATGVRPAGAVLVTRPAAPEGREEHSRDELAQIARALAGASAAIDAKHERLRARACVAAAAACSLDKAEVADAALIVIAEHVTATAGVVYWRMGDSLRPIATYAMEEAAPVRVGDGIAGRAALTAHPVVSGPADTDPLLTTTLGFADAPPKTLIAVPLQSQQEVFAVLLIASGELIDQPQQTFLRSACAQLTSGLRNALAYERLRQAARDAGCVVNAEDVSEPHSIESVIVAAPVDVNSERDLGDARRR